MSAILSADDLNDFILPGVACIKPVETPASAPPEAGEVELQIDENGNPLEISKIDGKLSKLQPAQISLADCLACLGCITSAEEVLVAQHSHGQLLNALQSPTDKVFVASVSHQSRASLAAAYGVSVATMDGHMIRFLAQLGFTYVVGTAVGRKISLIEEAAASARQPQKPVLSLVCPGWVLYAEKTHPHVLPYMSGVKLAQQITGSMLKEVVSHDLGIPKSRIYHLSIMPCFDKKLESARPEAFPQDEDVADVDCVLTAKELVNLAAEVNVSILANDVAFSPEIYSRYAPKSWPFKSLAWTNDSGLASGGYAYNYLVQKQAECEKDPQYAGRSRIVTVLGRNSDIFELRLMVDDQKLASAAVVNGFRNIQNLVRKLKPNAAQKKNPLAARRRIRRETPTSGSSDTSDAADPAKCDYVEIMACPEGCINGGGQISAPDLLQEKEWLKSVRQAYDAIPVLDLMGEAEKLESWIGLMSVPKNRVISTSFSAVQAPTDQASQLLGAKW